MYPGNGVPPPSPCFLTLAFPVFLVFALYIRILLFFVSEVPHLQGGPIFPHPANFEPLLSQNGP